MRTVLPLPLLIACAGTPEASGDTAAPADDTGEVEGATACWELPSELSEIELLRSCYGVLSTIAGTGEIPTKGVSGWDDSYEGGPATEAELSRPHMTMADPEGRLFIADKDAHAIRMIDLDGTITTVAGTGSAGDDGDDPGPGDEQRLSSPNGLWVAGDGTVYIHDMGNDKIRALDPSGELSTLFEVTDSSTGRGLWVADDASEAYVSAGSRIWRWTPDEGASSFATGFSSLGNLVIDPDGHVVVADRGGHDVTRVLADGTTERIAGTGSTSGGGDGEDALETGLAEVRGVWFHPLGGYFLATHAGGQIWYVDTDGIIHLFVDGESDHSHSGDGEDFDTEGKKISEPRAVVMDGEGRIVITENDHGYVRRIALAE